MKKGFASMYMIYTLFTIFIIMMFTTLMITGYKKNFLDNIKEDVKQDLNNYPLEEETEKIQ